MLINELDKLFNSEFHFYFDRDDNFNCYVSFNTLEFIKYYSSYPAIYDNEEFFDIIKDNINFNFYLFDGENIIKFDEVKKVELFENNSITTFLLRKDKKKLYANHKVSCDVGFRDYLYQYVSSDSPDFLGLGEYQYGIFKNDLKSILEKRYINQSSPSDPKRVYQFSSDFINFNNPGNKLSNLYDIFSENITVQDFTNFITLNQEARKITYDGNLPLTNYIRSDGENTALTYNYETNVGNIDKYLSASLTLIDDNYTRYDYKQIDFLNNIYLTKDNVVKREESIKTYETISSLQSTSCENNLFSQIERKELTDSDILYISNFIYNFNIDLNEFWLENPVKLPVYLLEGFTKYNIFFLERINETSMFEKWSLLTNDVLNNLNTGKYLCMISTQNSSVQKNIIENYFILEI